MKTLPFSLKILLENALRHEEDEDVQKIIERKTGEDISFRPARVLMQDFTGVPCLVDLAVMRDAIKEQRGDPKNINPQIPVDLVIDHSVQVDCSGSDEALSINAQKEFERNRERYEFLKWGQGAFKNLRIVPPATGIVHQVNLEYLAEVVSLPPLSNSLPRGERTAYPDTVVGTDSHTTMINGLGVLGWGVGGIEAESALLGQPISMTLPDVVGMELKGTLPQGTTATDLVLRVTEILRSHGVVGKFVEFYGDALDHLPLADRATIANMAPEYGATVGFFPVDSQTLAYLRLTGRSEDHINLVETYCKDNGLFRDGDNPPDFSERLSLNLGSIEPSLAGPMRPQDRIALTDMKKEWRKLMADTKVLKKPEKKKIPLAVAKNFQFSIFPKPVQVRFRARNFHAKTNDTNYKNPQTSSLTASRSPLAATKTHNSVKKTSELKNGDVVIAAITSCTNTSNPSVMIAAGLLAKKAREKGLTVPSYVKTSLAPGSTVVTRYLDDANLTAPLEELGFHTVGYGCTTCIGNSGPLSQKIEQEIEDRDLTVCSVLSGNRNFEGRVHQRTKANYLASPPLVVAYALAGTVDIDLSKEPIGYAHRSSDSTIAAVEYDDFRIAATELEPIYLKDIWPSQEEINDVIKKTVKPETFTKQYENVFSGNEQWNSIESTNSETYMWDKQNTYIQKPPFFASSLPNPLPQGEGRDIVNARTLLILGDSVTTDHISPAGKITDDSPAGTYLQEHGVKPKDFNSYGSRRGNDRIMTRGTFANIRIRNLLAPGTEGGVTLHLPSNSQMSVYDAAMQYKKEHTPLVVFAGKDYGMGSSRDWAAKGTLLLGVKAVIAQSYERIHRSNLIGMGVLPLQFNNGDSLESLGLTGKEVFDIKAERRSDSKIAEIHDDFRIVATDSSSNKQTIFTVTARIDTPTEVLYLKNGGILQTVLEKLKK